MREPGAVRHKLKQVSFRYLKRVLEDGLALVPKNCAHNRTFHHPVVAAGAPPAGVCVCPQQDGDLLCDPAWGGIERAQTCPLYEPLHAKEDLKQEYREFLAGSELAVIAKVYPDIAALMWILQEDSPGRDIEIGEDWEAVTPPPTTPAEVFPIQIHDRVVVLEQKADAEALQAFMADAERQRVALHLALKRLGEFKEAWKVKESRALPTPVIPTPAPRSAIYRLKAWFGWYA